MESFIFQIFCSNFKLKTKTIDILTANGLTEKESLLNLRAEDVNKLGLSLGQKTQLVNGLKSLGPTAYVESQPDMHSQLDFLKVQEHKLQSKKQQQLKEIDDEIKSHKEELQKELKKTIAIIEIELYEGRIEEITVKEEVTRESLVAAKQAENKPVYSQPQAQKQPPKKKEKVHASAQEQKQKAHEGAAGNMGNAKNVDSEVNILSKVFQYIKNLFGDKPGHKVSAHNVDRHIQTLTGVECFPEIRNVELNDRQRAALNAAKIEYVKERRIEFTATEKVTTIVCKVILSGAAIMHPAYRNIPRDSSDNK